MTSNRKQTSKSDAHIDILKRAERLSKSGSKVFDKDRLKADEEFLLRESKRLGLSQDDIEEIGRASTEEAAFEGANLSDQIAFFASTLLDYVEEQKQFIQDIESQREDLMELYRDRIELDYRDKLREMIESCWVGILSNITTNIAKESTFANRMISVNAKLQVSKKDNP